MSQRAREEVRVTHVVFDLQGGGMESLVASISRSLSRTPVRCSVITLSGRAGRIGEELRPVLDHLEVLTPNRGGSLLLPLGLVRALRTLRPDVVHLHSGAWYKGALAARLAGVPFVVYTEHGRIHHDPWLARRLDSLAARLTDVVVPVSHPLAEYMTDALGIPARKLEVIENGVDTIALSPGDPSPAARARLGIPPGVLVVGSVGRLERVKGYDRLLTTLASLQRRRSHGPPWFLSLCGDGSVRPELERLSEELGIRDSVGFAGWIDASAEVYRCFDVFAVTSRSEGLSLSLLEAMACGVVPVVNDVGANRDVLGTALAGNCVPDGAWDQFGVLVERLLADPARRAATGALAAERVRDRFSLERVVMQYLEVYGRARPGGSSGPRRVSVGKEARWTVPGSSH